MMDYLVNLSTKSKFECIATGSSGNCYILKCDSLCFLLDAGIKWDGITAHINMNNVDMAFISHEHKDHSLCLEKLRFNGVFVLDGINIHKPIKNENLSKFGTKYKTFLIPIQHGDTNNCALIVETDKNCILYATDFNVCKSSLKRFKFTRIIVECNYLEELIMDDVEKGFEKAKRQINTHMGLNGLMIFLDSLDLSECEEIDLIHMSQEYGDINIMGSSIYSRYRITTGVCLKGGGISYYGG